MKSTEERTMLIEYTVSSTAIPTTGDTKISYKITRTLNNQKVHQHHHAPFAWSTSTLMI
jgi:hypothetical protein